MDFGQSDSPLIWQMAEDDTVKSSCWPVISLHGYFKIISSVGSLWGVWFFPLTVSLPSFSSVFSVLICVCGQALERTRFEIEPEFIKWLNANGIAVALCYLYHFWVHVSLCGDINWPRSSFAASRQDQGTKRFLGEHPGLLVCHGYKTGPLQWYL